MDRDFAKQALLRGEKVHLDSWADNEYVYLKDNVVYDEHNTPIPSFIGVMETLSEFGWSIFAGKEKKEKPKNEPIRFENLLPALRENLVAARRRAWDVDTFIFAQVPAKVEKETIQGMISLPPVVKAIFEDDGTEELSYRHQIVMSYKGMVSYYTPSGDDLWADDWLVISEENAWSPYLSDIPKV